MKLNLLRQTSWNIGTHQSFMTGVSLPFEPLDDRTLRPCLPRNVRRIPHSPGADGSVTTLNSLVRHTLTRESRAREGWDTLLHLILWGCFATVASAFFRLFA